jgi:hypothetical protein
VAIARSTPAEWTGPAPSGEAAQPAAEKRSVIEVARGEVVSATQFTLALGLVLAIAGFAVTVSKLPGRGRGWASCSACRSA